MGMEEKECLREAKRKRERGDSGLEVRRTGCRGTASGGSASGWRGTAYLWNSQRRGRHVKYGEW